MKITEKDFGKEVEIAFEDLEETVIGILLGVNENGPVVFIPSVVDKKTFYMKMTVNAEMIVKVGETFKPNFKLKPRKIEK